MALNYMGNKLYLIKECPYKGSRYREVALYTQKDQYFPFQS